MRVRRSNAVFCCEKWRYTFYFGKNCIFAHKITPSLLLFFESKRGAFSTELSTLTAKIVDNFVDNSVFLYRL